MAAQDARSQTGKYPIAYGFAGLALLALLALAVLRHLFGSVRIDIGTR